VALSTASVAGASAHLASQAAKLSPTKLTLNISAGTLGQPVAFSATVSEAVSAGSPQGTVKFIDRGQTIGSLNLVPGTSSDPRSAVSVASGTMVQSPGGPAYWFGKHKITAVFVPNGASGTSRASTTFNVAPPAYSTITGGTQIATIAAGSGAAIQTGQTANVLYTGYLAKNGKVFDDSAQHGNTALSFQVGANQVVPGFENGVLGMKVGESRIIQIPASQGYGSRATGGIPANSTLVFVVTLQSIS
jgi:hypothetical protein